jgi:hypothetical protein
LKALVNTAVLRSSWTVTVMRNALVSPRARVKNNQRISTQDQCRILAQKILLCGNLRLEFFREQLFITRLPLAVKCRAGNCRVRGADKFVFAVRASAPQRGHSPISVTLALAAAVFP